jgi:phosphate transport system protein
MSETRRHFHQELRDVENRILAMGEAARGLFGESLRALSDPTLSKAVIAGDDQVDALWIAIERHVVELFALETPVACDLRLLTVLLHISLHLERVADMAVNLAKISWLTRGLPRHTTVLRNVEEMGGIALGLLEAAMDAFARRDLELARRLPSMDEPIDQLNRGMLAEVLRASEDEAMLKWAIEMHLVSRLIERVGDHAVDIGEQVAFLVTGAFEEFSDASHPGAGRRQAFQVEPVQAGIQRRSALP